MQLLDDCRRAIRPWVANPVRRVRLEAVALRRALYFHHDNNNFRKLTLVGLLTVWITITLGGPSGPQVNGIVYTILTALIFAIVGRQWGLEVRGLAPRIEISPEDENDDDDD